MGAQRRAGKLAVILHADVAGSTSLVQQDEHLTHERIQAAFRLFGNIIDQYHGRVWELRGDALLAEFERASDAVAAALAFQADHAEYNAELSDAIRPAVRVGIAMGEVIVADRTVTGAGVVLAQRMEQLAEPGSVCVTAAVEEAVPERLPFDETDLGEQRVKGFEKPVHVYTMRLHEGMELPGPVRLFRARQTQFARWGISAAVIMLISAGGLLAWYQPWTGELDQVSLETTTPPLPDKPSIAVLPFDNLSEDQQQEYFADGMTDDLITDLSKVPELFVISRNSTFTYKDQAIKIREVAEELGVRYVLEGSVRRSGNQVRINAQLIDGTTGGHMWANRFDGTLEDIFALQDRITRKISTALVANLKRDNEHTGGAGQTDNPKAYDAFLRGWAHYRLYTREDLAKSVPYLKKAITLDPEYGRAHAALASVYQLAWNTNWVRSLEMSYNDALEKAKAHLQQARKNRTPLAHAVASRLLTVEQQWDDALAEAEQAVALNPGDPIGYDAMARVLVRAGRAGEALEFIDQAMRLDPQGDYLWRLGSIQYHLERYEATAETMIRATRRNPESEWNHLLLAAAYGQLDRIDEARTAVKTFNRMRVDAGRSAYTLDHLNEWRFKNETYRERLRNGLRKAGLGTGSGVEIEYLSGFSPEQVEGATTIDPVWAKRLHDQETVFVDVREDADWKAGHIPGAEHLELHNDFSRERLAEIVQPDEKVVFYCAGPNCNWSAQASTKAVSWGYEQVYYFRAGFPHWKAAGFPVETR